MPGSVKPIPEGYHTVTPYLVVSNAAEALEFYAKAFGAKEKVRMPGPDGRIMHAEFQIGDSMIMMGEENPQSKSPQTLGGSPVSIFLYVEDVNSLFNQAVNAGARGEMPPQDMFWGDRCGNIVDQDGYKWMISTHIAEPTPQEMKRKMKEQMSAMAAAAASGS